MKRFVIVALALLALCAPAWGAQGKATKESLVFRERKRTYYLFAPGGVGAGAPAPLVVLLHGSGRNGLSLVERWKDLAAREGFVVAGPDAANPAGWHMDADGPDFLHAVVEAVRARHAVDRRRVYLFGHSAGAIFALLLSALESEYYAAAAAHAGALRAEDARLLDQAKRKTPVAIQVGTADPLFPLSVVRRTRDLFEGRGFEVELTEIAGHGHWYYDRAGEINGRAWEFLKRHALAAEPRLNARAAQRGRGSKEAVEAYQKGFARHRAGDLAGAIADYTRALKADPDLAPALTNRGTAHLALGDYAAAVADLSRSIALDPSEPLAYSNRGNALRALKRLDEAVADYTRSLELKPTAETFHNRAVAYGEAGQDELAVADYTKAVEHDPQLAEAYAYRGLIHLRRGRDAEAEADFERAFRLKPALRPEIEPHIRNTRLTRRP